MTARGFSLVELLVVLVILSVVAGVVIPAYVDRNVGGARDQAVLAVRAVAAHAHLRAVRDGVPVTLDLDPATGAYREMAIASGAPSDSAVVGMLALPSGYLIQSSSPRLRLEFDPTGTVRGGVLTLAGPSGAVIRMDSWTGEPES